MASSFQIRTADSFTICRNLCKHSSKLREKMSLQAIYNKLKRNKSFKYGIPFLVLMVGGSFGLQEFTRIRYQFSKQQTVTPDEMEEHGIAMKKPKEVTIDKIYEKVKDLNLDDWENKRGPRPWEENFDSK